MKKLETTLTTQDIQDLRVEGLRWIRGNQGFRSLTHDDHEDVVQQALLELLGYDGDVENPGGLLGTIIDCRAKNLIRSKQRRGAVELAAGDATDLSILSDNIGMTIEGAIFASDFDSALRGLPEDDRDAFILNELRGLTNYETAIHLGITPSTVAYRVDRAKDALRKEL